MGCVQFAFAVKIFTISFCAIKICFQNNKLDILSQVSLSMDHAESFYTMLICDLIYALLSNSNTLQEML